MKIISKYWLWGISLILLGTSLFLNISHTVVTNESIVLVFVGVLATFIVVGNYAQVIEIRNSANAQIKGLEDKFETKIEELNRLRKNVEGASIKIYAIEKNVYYVAAEAYRLYGIFCVDKGLHRYSCRYLLDAISQYESSYEKEFKNEYINNILDIVLKNLNPEKWSLNCNDQKEFNYQKYIEISEKLSDNYSQKQKIIELLKKHQVEEQKL